MWRSDGTGAGTTLVKDLDPRGDSNPSVLTDVDGTLFFTADGGIWKSDGTDAGTVFVTEAYGGFAGLGSTLFYAFDDGVLGPELWALDLGP